MNNVDRDLRLEIARYPYLFATQRLLNEFKIKS